MAVRAFACVDAATGRPLGFVATTSLETWPAGTLDADVRVGTRWIRARLDRSAVVEVESQLLRDAVPVDVGAAAARAASAAPMPAAPPVPDESEAAASGSLQAAAISLQGRNLVVALVARELIDRPGEAAMAAADLSARFGGVELVLMGQDDDGTPHFHGDPALCTLLEGVPLERMPWRPYQV